MDHFKAAWGVVKENLLQWVLFTAVLSILMSVVVGFLLVPNFYRAARRAIEQRQAPDFAELFNFDHIADDAVVMLIYAAAIAIGVLVFGIASYIITIPIGLILGKGSLLASILTTLIGTLISVIGPLASMTLFFWMPMLAAEGRMEPVDTLKAALAHTKSNIGGILVFVILVWLINTVATIFCVIPLLIAAPVTYVAMWIYFDAERDNIYRLAAAEGIQLRG